MSPVGVAALKIAVITMGVLVVVGMIVVVARVIYLASKSKPVKVAPSKIIAQQGSVALPPDATIRQISLDVNRLAIFYNSNKGSGIVIMDIRTGKQLSHITVTSDQAER